MLGSLFAILYGAIFHLWKGGGPYRLLLYITLSFGGFWGGQWIADLVPFSLGSLGPLQLGLATLGSIATLIIGYWLSKVENVKT